MKRGKVQRVRRSHIDTPIRSGMRIEQVKPAVAAATAMLVIAAHKDPRSDRQQRRGGAEKVLLPDSPVVTRRTARAGWPRRRTGCLPAVVVADMYDEVGMASGGQSRHLCKRPL